ncbi:MAG TPA: GAF domain-containing protein, partial [Terriglobales bacterium]|nr:GAF domain-containing protein [Terriglobales bacterium]
MEITIGAILVPGIFAALLLLLFTYLYEQSRETYFRAWQGAWAAYCLHYALQVWTVFGTPTFTAYLLSRLLFVAMAMGIYISSRLVTEDFRLRWDDITLGGISVVLCVVNVWGQVADGRLSLASGQPRLEMEVVVACILAISAWRFYRLARQRDSLGFHLLALSLIAWAPLLVLRQFHGFFERYLGNAGYLMGPLAQMLIGVSMVIVLFDNERRIVQENALAFSTLDVDSTHLLTPPEIAPALRKLLDRMMRVIRVDQAATCIAERWRTTLPSVTIGLPQQLLEDLQTGGVGEYLSEMAYRRGGLATFANVAEMSEPLPAGPPGRFERFQVLMRDHGLHTVTAISLQTRDRNFGVIVFPHSAQKALGPSQVRLLLGMAMQIAMTLENYVVMHDTQRRTREYELLTQIGQVISSRLDPDEVLRSIHKELGLLFDTNTFYVAFLDGDDVRFDLDCVEGKISPKRSRKVANGLTEYVIRSGQPILVRSDMEKFRAKLGVTYVPQRPAKSYCAAPIFMGGRAVGVLAAMNFDREFVYEQRDLEVLQTAAGQVAVAIENARLFSEEQRRSRYLAFLNTVSKMAISSQDAEQMLAEIVSEIQENFAFDHIGIGILDYVTKEIEIKAEAGSSAHTRGKRVPLSSGTMGRAARTGEMVLIQTPTDGHSTAVLPDTRSVLCIPITYGDGLLGVLNVESRRERAFAQQDILILRTLADLLATALHNAFVFQKLQQ